LPGQPAHVVVLHPRGVPEQPGDRVPRPAGPFVQLVGGDVAHHPGVQLLDAAELLQQQLSWRHAVDRSVQAVTQESPASTRSTGGPAVPPSRVAVTKSLAACSKTRPRRSIACFPPGTVTK